MTEVGFVEVAGGLGVQVQPPPIEGPPHAVGALGHVGHEHVGVEVRVPGPAGAVPERGGDQAVDLDLVDPVLPGPGPGCARVRRRRTPRRPPPRAQRSRSWPCPGSPRTASSDTDFGARKVRSNPAIFRPGNRASASPVAGCWPAHMACSSLGGDLTLEAEGRGGGAGPTAGCFADTAVVLVDPVGDGVRGSSSRRSGGSCRGSTSGLLQQPSRPCRTSPGPVGTSRIGTGPGIGMQVRDCLVVGFWALDGSGGGVLEGRVVRSAVGALHEGAGSAEEAELSGGVSGARARGRARGRCRLGWLRHDDADTHRRQVDPVGRRQEPARQLVTVVDSLDDPEGDHRGEGTSHRVLGHPDEPGQRSCAALHLNDPSAGWRERGDRLEHHPADRAPRSPEQPLRCRRR